MNTIKIICFLLVVTFLVSCKNETGTEFSEFREIPFDQVIVNDQFWSPRIQTIQETTIPELIKIAEEQGKIDNLRIIAGRKKDGQIKMYNSPDSDIWKIMEAASYSLSWRSNPKLEEKLDELIKLYAEAQADDGYINQMFMLPDAHPQSPPDASNVRLGYGKDQRFKGTIEEWPLGIGQLYSAGHLLEAAVAHYRATGKKTFLIVAIEMADCIYREFSPGQPIEYADHPQLGIGLVKLYEVTGDEKYLELANHYVHHGHHARPVDLGDRESWKPIEEQRKAWGHAVRINYLYSAATDLSRYLGQQETREALHSLWHSIVDRRIYLHGGNGGPAGHEQIAEDWNLNPLTTYSECCANIAHGQWNHRLNVMTGDASYADITEIEAYNGALSGISLDGSKYFYTNPLTVDLNNRNGYHGGVRESYLFCCPSKLTGFVAGISRWIFAKNPDGIVVNLFIGSTLNTEINDRKIKITQETNYPWNENVKLTVQPEKPEKFTLSLRIPGWIRKMGPFPSSLYSFADNNYAEWEIKINDKLIHIKDLQDGYAQITREWKSGDKVELYLPMHVRQVYSHPKVEATKGKVALMYGPLLYCLEGIDNDFNVLEAALASNPEFEYGFDPDLLGGVMVLTGNAVTSKKDSVRFKAIPYYAWQNRGIYEMTTWLYREASLIKNATSLISIDSSEINTDG